MGTCTPTLSTAILDKLIEFLIKNQQTGYNLSDNDFNVIHNYIVSQPFKSVIYDYLTSHNITAATFCNANAQDMIFNIISQNSDIEIYNHYIKSPLSLKDLPKHGILLDVLKKTELSCKTITDLIYTFGTESGRVVGKGEIMLASIFDDIKMIAGYKDLDWNGRYLEVKCSRARLGARNRSDINFFDTTLGQLVKKYNITTCRIDLIVKILSGIGISRDTILKSLQEFIDISYQNNTIKNTLHLDNFNELRKNLIKIYFNNYIEQKNVDVFIFINTSKTKFFTRYIVVNKHEVNSYIESETIKTAPVTYLDLNPPLNAI